ncbi:MAG: response regulator transcription factor [Saprospiraceae bacterium]|nr:response regulator transcription factor [Saprospiraceae bacterium]
MTILILEDEPLVGENLLALLRELEPAAVVHGPLASVRETRDWFASHPVPDLILSDIQLSDGISFDALQAHTRIPVIFTTAFDEYAIRAFRLNSVDYLLKPIDLPELKSALDKFHALQDKFSNEQFSAGLRQLLQNFTNMPGYKERFAVHSGRSVVLVAVEEVVCFLKDQEVIFLFDKSGQRYITDYRSLDEVEELVNSAVFFRANRQALVHLPYIAKYETDFTGKIFITLRLKPAPEVMVSKEKAAGFKKWLG